jgi:hypothetical protein
MARVAVQQLLVTDVALDKLGARAISRRRPSSFRAIIMSLFVIRVRERQGAGGCCSLV